MPDRPTQEQHLRGVINSLEGDYKSFADRFFKAVGRSYADARCYNHEKYRQQLGELTGGIATLKRHTEEATDGLDYQNLTHSSIFDILLWGERERGDISEGLADFEAFIGDCQKEV